MGQYLGLARIEDGQHLRDLRIVGFAAKRLEGSALGLVFHQVTQRRVAFQADRLIERGGAIGDGLHVDDLRERDLHRHGDFVVMRLAADLGGQAGGHAAHLRDTVDHVHRKADGLSVRGEGALDGLLDPPGGVGAELAPLIGVEALDGLDQPEVAFADEVHERQPEIIVILGDTDDQSEVRLDHLLAGGFVALEDATCQRGLLFQRQQRRLADLIQVIADRRTLFRG